MPTTPQATGPTVRSQPLPAPLANPSMASPDAFGASIAEGLQRGAEGIHRGNQIAQQERQKVSDTKAMDAYLKVSEADGKLTSAARLKTGDNVRDLPNTYNQDYQKLVDEQAQALRDDPDALETFKAMAERRRVSSVADIQRHTDVELDKFQTATWEAGQIQARQDGLDGVLTLDQSLAQQQANRMRLADIKGIPQAEADLLWQDDKNKTIGGAIAQMQKAGDFDGARATFDQYGKDLSPELRASIKQDLEKGQQAVKAQTYAAAIMQDPNQSRAKAYQQLKMIDDPALRESTRINVEREFAQREAVKADAQAATYESFADAIEAGESYDSLVAKNPLAAGQLDQRQTDALRRVEQNAIERKQPEEWGDTYTAARNTWSLYPEEFSRMDLRLYKGQMTKAEFADLNERQQLTKQQLTKATAKQSDKARGFLTVDQVVKSTLRDIGINPNVEDGKVDPRATRFTMLMDKKVEAAGGAAVVTNEQVRKMADDLLIEVQVDDPASTAGKFLRYGTFGAAGFAGIGVDGTRTVRTFELPGADRFAFSVDQIPAAERTRAVQALKGAGLTDPTPDEIMEYYNGRVKGQVVP